MSQTKASAGFQPSLRARFDPLPPGDAKSSPTTARRQVVAYHRDAKLSPTHEPHVGADWAAPAAIAETLSQRPAALIAAQHCIHRSDDVVRAVSDVNRQRG